MKIKDFLSNNNLDAIYISSLVNIRYISRFTGSAAKMICTKDMNYLLVDTRYVEQAKKQCSNVEVILDDRINTLELIKEILLKYKVEKLGFEQDNLLVQDYLSFKKLLDVQLVPLSLAKLRMAKTDEEIAVVKKACHVVDKAFNHIFNFVKVGMSEQDIANELHKFILDNKAEGLAFTTIVASGKRSSMPHGVASDKIIEENDIVTIDFGAFVDGYCADVTRTFFVKGNNNSDLEKIYNIVLEAQLLAINAIKPGVKASEIDKIARDYISDKGYGDFFTHGLGHGIGLEIHEFPFLSSKDDTILEPGFIITVEPGIYLPGIGGVRIEDDILVTNDGFENLTNITKELICVNN